MYSCEHCENVFSSKNVLLTHLRETHKHLFISKNRKVRKCDVCLKEISYSNFRKHQRGSHNIISVKRQIAECRCYDCAEKFDSRNNTAAHFESVHNIYARDVKKIIECKICGKEISRSNIRKHEKLVHKVQFPEPKKPDVPKIMYFSGKQKLVLPSYADLSTADDTEDVFSKLIQISKFNLKIDKFEDSPRCFKIRRCVSCQKDISASNFRKHERNVHGIKNPPRCVLDKLEFTCDTCDEKFRKRSSIISHLRTKHHMICGSEIKLLNANKSLIEYQKDSLPCGYEYKFTKKVDLEDKFLLVFKFFLQDQSSLDKWINEYEQKNYTCLRHGSGVPRFKNKSVVQKVVYRCVHNSKPRRNVRPREKHTGCPFRMFTQLVRSRPTRENVAEELMAVVTLRHRHNHPLNERNWAKYKTRAPAAREEFQKSFEEGHGPAEALERFKRKFQPQREPSATHDVADGGGIPKSSWLHYQMRRATADPLWDSIDVQEVSVKEDIAVAYNRDKNDNCIAANMVDGSNSMAGQTSEVSDCWSAHVSDDLVEGCAYFVEIAGTDEIDDNIEEKMVDEYVFDEDCEEIRGISGTIVELVRNNYTTQQFKTF